MHSKDVLNMEKTLNTYSIFKIQPFELKNSCNKLYFDIQYSILSTYKSHFHLFYCEVLPEKRPTQHFSEGAHDGRFWRFGLQCEPVRFIVMINLSAQKKPLTNSDPDWSHPLKVQDILTIAKSRDLWISSLEHCFTRANGAQHWRVSADATLASAIFI